MRILITGGTGQLGQALLHTLKDADVTATGSTQVDISQRGAISDAIQQMDADIVINCAAYTNVDGSARDPEYAYRINGLGAQNIALACRAAGIPMVHVSTNEVFDGQNSHGYEEWQPVNPANPYGKSKAAGEFHVRHVLPESYIVRTAWLYSATGRNFIHAVLRRAREEGRVRVVTDEIGNPTYTADVAAAIAQLITTGQFGTYHFVNEGSCSRWQFAQELLSLAGLSNVPNEKILSSEFKRASTPPPFGHLHNIAGRAIGIELRPWQKALADCLTQIEAPAA